MRTIRNMFVMMVAILMNHLVLAQLPDPGFEIDETTDIESEPSAFICTPCGLSCDTLTFSSEGLCPHCQMKLIHKPQIDQVEFETGSGSFLLSDNRDSTKTIQIFYHMPIVYNDDSWILMVVPGAGRNGDDYRDSWVEMSEKYNVLILSPSFNEIYYSFEEYHLGGLIQSSNLMKNITRIEGTNKVQLDERTISYEVNSNKDQWIYDQFDRIFDLVKKKLNSNRERYDLFGHSAGGHILHRMALFYTGEKANRMLASNASFYTLPTQEYIYPFGIGNVPFTNSDLAYSFRNNLIVFLGEADNANETGGTFLLSKSAAQQGGHRFERGKYFYDESREKALKLGHEFNWNLEVIEGVGHNYRKIGEAAGEYLYNN